MASSLLAFETCPTRARRLPAHENNDTTFTLSVRSSCFYYPHKTFTTLPPCVFSCLGGFIVLFSSNLVSLSDCHPTPLLPLNRLIRPTQTDTPPPPCQIQSTNPDQRVIAPSLHQHTKRLYPSRITTKNTLTSRSTSPTTSCYDQPKT